MTQRILMALRGESLCGLGLFEPILLELTRLGPIEVCLFSIVYTKICAELLGVTVCWAPLTPLLSPTLEIFNEIIDL